MRFWKPSYTTFFFSQDGQLVKTVTTDADDEQCLEVPVFIRKTGCE